MKTRILKKGFVLICSSVMLGTVFLTSTVSLASERSLSETENQIQKDPLAELTHTNLAASSMTSAEEEVDFYKFDEFVTVENNQYVLTLPRDHSFSANEISIVEQQLSFSNNLVFENQAVLDEETETAVIQIPDGSRARGIGNTYVKIYWNYISVGIARHLLRAGITGSASAVAGSLAGYYTWGTTTKFVSTVVASLVGAYAANKIHSGIWFHLNYAYGINNYGWQ